jgi:hypothetical protein
MVIGNGKVELLTYDKTNRKYNILEITMEGQLSDAADINTEIPEHTVIHMKNKTVYYYLQNEHQLILRYPIGQHSVISLPADIVPKAIKSFPNGDVVVAGNYKEGFIYEGKQYISSGYTNVVFLQFTDNGSHISTNIIPKNRDEYIEGFEIKGTKEVAYYGKYIESVYSYYDSTNIRIDSCIFTEILSIDTISCTTFPSKLTFDQELCELSWDNVPEG